MQHLAYHSDRVVRARVSLGGCDGIQGRGEAGFPVCLCLVPMLDLFCYCSAGCRSPYLREELHLQIMAAEKVCGTQGNRQ